MAPRKHRWPAEEIARLADLHDYILLNLHEDLSLAALARKVAMNEKKLNALFFYVYREKLPQFVRSSRMKRASDLLLKTDLSIKQVAAACGYASHFAFHRAFVQFYGKTPASLRAMAS